MTTTKNEKSITQVHPLAITYAEPASLGLIGLAVAALVLGAADLGLTNASSKYLMVPWILFFGATAQLVAGLVEFKRNNVFGATVFSTYAMTMYAIAATLIIILFTGVTTDISHYAFGLIGILFFSLIATIASLRTNMALFSILIAVDLAVVLLIPHYLSGFSSIPAGIFLIATSLLSFYTSAAVLLNTMAGKIILPLGGPLWKQ
jgi:uncharacterized protein